MKRNSRKSGNTSRAEMDEILPEYDFSEARPNKYASRYHAGTNLVLLDPDVRKAFGSERAINQALRLVIQLRKVGKLRQP